MYSGGLNLNYLNGSSSLNQFNPAKAVQASSTETNRTFDKVFERTFEQKATDAVRAKKLNNENENAFKETSIDTSIKRPEPIVRDNESQMSVEEVQVPEEVENVLNEVKEAMNETDLKKVKKLLETLSEELEVDLPVEELVAMLETESLVPINDLLEFMKFMFDGDLETVGTEMIETLEVELNQLIEGMIETVQNNEVLTESDQTTFESQLNALVSEMEQVEPEVLKEVLKAIEVEAPKDVLGKGDASAKGILEKLGLDVQTSEPVTEETSLKDALKNVESESTSEEAQAESKRGLRLGQTGKATGQQLQAQVDETGMKPIEIFKDQNTNVTTVKTTPMMNVSSKDIFDQVLQGTNRMNFNVTETGSEMLLKLKPQELGQVELKVSIEKGVLLAEMTVENETVKAALESNMADLKSALSQKGYDIEGLNVSVGHQDKGQSEEQHQNSQKRVTRSIDVLDEEFDTQMEVTEVSETQINYLG